MQQIFKSQLEYGKFGQCICTPVCYILGHTFLTMKETPILDICSGTRINSIMQKSHDFYAQSEYAKTHTLLMIEDMHVCIIIIIIYSLLYYVAQVVYNFFLLYFKNNRLFFHRKTQNALM